MEAFVYGEGLDTFERVIVSPIAGRFYPDEAIALNGAASLRVGQRIGYLAVFGAEPHDVVSRFSGTLVEFLAKPGERVTPGRPVAWLRVDEPNDAPR